MKLFRLDAGFVGAMEAARRFLDDRAVTLSRGTIVS